MKKLFIYILPLIALLMGGCKEENWMDWKLQNEMWLANNAKQEGVITTESGLQYKVLSPGNTTDAQADDASYVVCDYEGKLINDYVFDSGTGAEFSVSQVVSGFAEGLKKIHRGGDIIIYIPQDLGYGADGTGTEGSLSSRFIPPYSTLIFKVHISTISK